MTNNALRAVLTRLPVLTDLRRDHHACPRGRTRKQIKGTKDRAEAKAKKSVRAQCVERDGLCRLLQAEWMNPHGDFFTGTHICAGPSEWAHIKRRAQTRGQAPELRHTTADSLILCRLAHDYFDGRQHPRLRITALSRRGADGPLKFTRAK